MANRFVERHQLEPELKTSRSVGIDITVADNRTYRSLSSIPKAPIRLSDGVVYPSTLCTLPLPSGVDVLLGTDWLNQHRASISFTGGASAVIHIGESSLKTASVKAQLKSSTPPFHPHGILSITSAQTPRGTISQWKKEGR